MRRKALMLVLLVFIATFATFSALVVTNSRGRGQGVGFIRSPSLIHVINATMIRPNEAIDTPGGPT